MQTVKVAALPYIRDPRDGRVLLANDLPQPEDLLRWSSADKAVITMAVEAGLVTEGHVLTTYSISAEEFERWRRLYEQGGRQALRTTRQLPLPGVTHSALRATDDFLVGTALLCSENREVIAENGLYVSLDPKRFDLLEYLCRNKGVVLPKIQIFEYLYCGVHNSPHIKIVDVFMSGLRKKLKELPELDFSIETVWGRGYVLKERASGDAT